MRSPEIYDFPYTVFSWTTPLFALQPDWMRQFKLLELFELCQFLMVILHLSLVTVEYWEDTWLLFVGLLHCLCYHFLATVYLPYQMDRAYERDISELPYNHRVPWVLVIFLVTIALDSHVKMVMDFFFGAPPTFQASDFHILFGKLLFTSD